MNTVTEPALGAQSEVGTLRTVLVHRPDLAHERLSPSNCHELLFDDVIWVRRARQEFDAFVDTMRERGVEVLLLHDLLTETLEDSGAREWVLTRRLRPEEVTAVFVEGADRVDGRDAGGRARDAPHRRRDRRRAARRRWARSMARAMRPNDFVIAPLPNHLFTRDTSAWIYGGVSLNHDVLAGAPEGDAQRRGRSTASTRASARPSFPIWFGGFDHDWGGATLEGGDVMPVGDGVLLVGQGERIEGAGGEHPRAEPVRRRTPSGS